MLHLHNGLSVNYNKHIEMISSFSNVRGSAAALLFMRLFYHGATAEQWVLTSSRIDRWLRAESLERIA